VPQDCYLKIFRETYSPQDPDNINTVEFFRKFAAIFAAQRKKPLSLTAAANRKNLHSEKF
jgi:hypothetical protein